MKEQLIEKIVELEWQQFQQVQNEGGRARCQDNRPTFNIMRTSQFLVWEMEILESYYQDLQDADAKYLGDNPKLKAWIELFILLISLNDFLKEINRVFF